MNLNINCSITQTHLCVCAKSDGNELLGYKQAISFFNEYSNAFLSVHQPRTFDSVRNCNILHRSHMFDPTINSIFLRSSSLGDALDCLPSMSISRCFLAIGFRMFDYKLSCFGSPSMHGSHVHFHAWFSCCTIRVRSEHVSIRLVSFRVSSIHPCLHPTPVASIHDEDRYDK